MALSRIYVILFLVLLIGPSAARADQEGSGYSYRAYTADRKHVFVMLNREAPASLPDKDAQYSVSGMYLNDGSTTPIWTVDWAGGVYLPNGGEYIVRRGRWARYSGTYNEEEFTLYRRNQPLRSYTVQDLVDFPWLLSHSASHYTVLEEACEATHKDGSVVIVGGSEYPNNGSVRFDDANRKMEIRTQLGDRLRFDLISGEMISANRPARMICVAAFAFLLLVYLTLRYLGVRVTVRIESNVVTGFLAAIAIITVPTIAVYAVAAAACEPEFAPNFFDRMLLAVYLLPPYLISLIAPNPPGSETVITVGSVATGLKTVGFWSVAIVAFTLLDRLVSKALFELRKSW
jgi:hypothetical protein